jgi:hypothetical protein
MGSASEILGRTEFAELLSRLSNMSIEDYYNPYRIFEWPDTLPTDELWMPRDLLTPYGTELMDDIDEADLIRLSQWESINFYSVNVHGIKELLGEVTRRLHSPGFEQASEFFHHFIGEENEHAWFFAEFCLRYGKKLYPMVDLKTSAVEDKELEHFLVFAKILIFEEIVDYFNTRMADDESLHETIRQVNRIHHKDESRHIAFGRQLVKLLFEQVQEKLPESKILDAERYLKRYMKWCLGSFYNPEAYRDAAMKNPLKMRQTLIEHPDRNRIETDVFLRKPMANMMKIGVFKDRDIVGVR